MDKINNSAPYGVFKKKKELTHYSVDELVKYKQEVKNDVLTTLGIDTKKGIYLASYKANHPNHRIIYQDINGKRPRWRYDGY